MKKIIGKYIVFIILLIDYFFSIFLRSNPKKTNGIILIRLDGIGDFILWLYSAEKIRENVNEKITLICNSSCFELAKNLEYFDEVIPVNYDKMKFNLKYKYIFFKKIKKYSYKILINPIYSRNIISEGIVKNIFAEEKLGIDEDYSNLSKNLLKITNKFYTGLLKIDAKEDMELYKNLKFINILFKKNYKLELPQIKLKENKKIIKDDYCMFFLGASNIKKCWEIEKFIKIAEYIPMNLKIVLSGSKKEELLGKKFVEDIKNKEKVINLIGKTTLLETMELIKNSKFIIGNDTFSSHIAPLFRVKSICILGGGHFGRFMPYPKELDNKEKSFLPQVVYKNMECFNCNWRCKYDDIPWKCIKNIEVENVKKFDNIFYCLGITKK